MFGKLMSISDDLMWRYFELLSFRPLGEIEQLERRLFVEQLRARVDKANRDTDGNATLIDDLQKLWKKAPAKFREDSELAGFYAGLLLNADAPKDAARAVATTCRRRFNGTFREIS